MKLIYFRKTLYHSIQKGNDKQRKASVMYMFCSPNSNTVVLASFCRAASVFPLSHFGHPPNMVAWVHPGHKLIPHIRPPLPRRRLIPQSKYCDPFYLPKPLGCLPLKCLLQTRFARINDGHTSYFAEAPWFLAPQR